MNTLLVVNFSSWKGESRIWAWN